MKNVIVALVAVMFTSCSVQGPKKSKNIDTAKETNTTQTNSKGVKMVLVSTAYGDIKIRLYDETPLHRDNFVKLVESGFYNELLFHRVIQGFMIQGGDPQGTGMGGPGYKFFDEPNKFNLNFLIKSFFKSEGFIVFYFNSTIILITNYIVRDII